MTAVQSDFTLEPQFKTISAKALWEMIQRSPQTVLVDVRTPLEYATVHATPARSVPLDTLTAQQLPASRPLYFICKSGKRAAQACTKMMDEGIDDVWSVDGGTEAWEAAGLPVQKQRGVISLERQVRIGAGAMVLAGVVLAVLVHPYFIGLSGFVGAGLIFAGVTDWCGMGMLIARMPWNRHQAGATCSTPSA